MNDAPCKARTPAVPADAVKQSHGRRLTANPTSFKLEKAIAVCLALAILVPPFVFGGRESIGQLTLAFLALFAFTLWIIRQIGEGPRPIPWRRPEIFVVLVALTLTLFTSVPLPFAWVRMLSPGIGRLLPTWTNGTFGEQGSNGWHYFSLAPGSTRAGAIQLAVYALLFWITLDTIRTRESTRRLLGVFFLTGIGVGAVGLLHYLFWNGKFYGLWELWWVEPDRHMRAPFTNRNHFAGFLALTIGPGIASLAGIVRSWKRSVSYVAAGAACRKPNELILLISGVGLVLILASIFLSQSRGGTIVGAVALVTVTLGLFRAGFTRTSSLVVMALIALAGLGTVLTIGREDPFQRTVAMLEGDQSLEDLSNQRLRLWKADLNAVWDFPWLGSGVGTHPYVYPLYLEKAHHVTFTHAENGYIQVLVECGLAGAALLVLAIYYVCTWCLRNLRMDYPDPKRGTAPVALALAVSLLAALIHGAVDFVWYVPAYAAALAVLAGLACSLYRNREFPSPKQRSRFISVKSVSWSGKLAWGCGLAVAWVALVGISSFHFANQARAELAWGAYFRLLPAANETGSRPIDAGTLHQRADLLAETCRSGSPDPDHHYRLGLVYLELFLERQQHARNTFSLAEARAILQGQRFTDAAKAQAWLDEVYGDDLPLLKEAQASFRRSLECCPLLGPAYLRLADLCFLDGARSSNSGPLCREALLVRPHDPAVHLQGGLEDWSTGDFSSAKARWRSACQLQPSYRWHLLPLLAEQLPAAEAVDFIPLDFEGLKWLAQKELEMGRASAARYVAKRAEEAVEADPDRLKNANAWLTLHELYRDIHWTEKCEACLRKAVQVAPTQLGHHLHLIRWLMEQGRWEEALEQAQRTRQTTRNDTELQNLVRDILAMKAPPSADARSKPPGAGNRFDARSRPP